MKFLSRTVCIILSMLMMFGSVNVVGFADVSSYKSLAFSVSFEAEEYSLMNAPMTLYKDKSATGEYYVAPTVNSSSMTSPQRNYAHLTYDVTIPEDDVYYVWMRVSSTNTAKYYACFDDGVYKKQSNLENIAYQDQWVWVCDDKYKLSKGEHQFKIRYCSTGMKYDAFYITNDHTYTPEGAEPSIISPYELYKRDGNGNITNLYYNLPTFLPPDEHPRLLFRKSDIERIKENLTHEQNIGAYNSLLKKADYKTDGIMPELQYGQASNIDMNVALMIESNAFLYQITGDKSYGYKAIEVSRNYMETCMVDKTNATSTGRTIMQAIWSVALCYDWCYDLLTEDDKEFLIFYMLYNTKYSEPSYPPIKYEADQSSQITGHILEFQFLGGMTAVAIATYDEIPDYYNIVAGRLQQNHIPAVNRFNKEGTYSEGSAYGMYRHYYEVLNNYMFKAMGFENSYYEEGLSALSYFYTRQPDGELIAEGDDYNYNKTGYVGGDNHVLFMLGNMLGNSYFKTEYYRGNIKDDMTTSIPGHVSPVMWLIINDVDVKCDMSFRNFPLTMYSGDDLGHMYARTNWDEGFDSNSVICTMNLKTHFLMGHEHKDVGHFNIYYKGLLALDSGIYEGSTFVNSKGENVTSVGYNNDFHFGYTRQSIAHNTLLVYDPNETKKYDTTNVFLTYDGGQNLIARPPRKLSYISEYDTEKAVVGKILSYNWGPDLNKPTYSYIKGDITDSYSDKVEEYQRSFVFFNFENDTYPASLIVFDAVRSSSPTFKKTWLLQTQEEPVIKGNSTYITRNSIDYKGRLINQTLMPNNGVTINKVGYAFNGISKYDVNGTLYEMKPKSDVSEVGNWRIEISPKKAEKQTYFLNVIQIGDNDENIVPLQSKLIEETVSYVGVEINNHVAYLRKDGLSKSKNFTIYPGKSDSERFFVITGLAAGEWTVYDEKGMVVSEEYAYDKHDSISFKATGGKFVLKNTRASNFVAPDYTVFGLSKNETKCIDVIIDGCFQTYKNNWLEFNGTVYAPVAEVMEKFDIPQCTVTSTSVDVNSDTVKYKYVNSENGITTINGIIYAPIELIEETVGCLINYNSISSIVNITYGNKERDKAKIFKYDDPAIANILTAYTEGETTAAAYKSLDNNTATYSCTLGEGTFVAILEKPSTISKVALFWVSGSKRQEIFEMYVSADNENWTEVFAGKSDGVTNGFEYVPVGGTKKYKYIKIVCHGNTSSTYNSLAEIIVYKEVQ